MAIVIVTVIFCAVAVWFALGVARRVQRSLENHGRAKQAEEGVGWLGHIHGIWWIVGACAAGLKYVFKAWRAAPAGSAEKLGWGALLALIAALGVFAVVKLVDRKLNAPHDTDSVASVGPSAEGTGTYTHGR